MKNIRAAVGFSCGTDAIKGNGYQEKVSFYDLMNRCLHNTAHPTDGSVISSHYGGLQEGRDLCGRTERLTSSPPDRAHRGLLTRVVLPEQPKSINKVETGWGSLGYTLVFITLESHLHSVHCLLEPVQQRITLAEPLLFMDRLISCSSSSSSTVR
ncbi:uncharacterized protein V6R79_019156 [Siganus canaliculatus]